jgi:hypothetical protein
MSLLALIHAANDTALLVAHTHDSTTGIWIDTAYCARCRAEQFLFTVVHRRLRRLEHEREAHDASRG